MSVSKAFMDWADSIPEFNQRFIWDCVYGPHRPTPRPKSEKELRRARKARKAQRAARRRSRR